jgi:uncharacterized membrane protein YeaQ/YmgE (transglycosylase-associated protein family)
VEGTGVSKLLGVLISVIMGVVSLVVTQTLTSSLDTSKMPSGVQALIEVIPIVLAATIILGAFAYIGGDEDTFVVGPIKHYVRIKRWDQFGTRLKVAYKAKFGYGNSGFDQRVDELVLSMRATSSKSLTYKQNEEALKRLSKFVEVKFVVPEEGKWSEVKRTRELDRELHEKYQVPLPKRLMQDKNYIPFTQAEPAQVKESDGFSKLGFLSNLVVAAAMSEQQPEAKKEPEFNPNAGYEEEVSKVDETTKVLPITDEDVAGIVPGEFANEPTPKMAPRPVRRHSWRFWEKEKEKVPVRRK